MRSERRHELQQNELADWMGNLIGKIKPYANAILAAVLLLVIVAVATTLWIQKSRAQATAAWDVFYGALESGNPAGLDEVVEQYPDSQAAQWASVLAGDVHLSSGCQERFTSRATANEEINRAVECYGKVLDESPNAVVCERATFGLARARESLGELDKARKHYEEIVQHWPDGPYAATAKQRLEDLTRPATKAFYDQFAEFDPKPAYSTEPGMPGQRLPFDQSSLPAGGENLFPPFDPLKLPEGGALEERPSPPTDKASKPGEAADATGPKEGATKLPAEPPGESAAKPAADAPKDDLSKPPADAPPSGPLLPGPPSTPAAPETPEEKKPDGK